MNIIISYFSGKNLHPKNPNSKEKEDPHRKERWNFIPQARRGLNRGYGAIRRPHHSTPDLQPQRNSPYAPRNSPSRLRMRFQDTEEDTEDSSTADDADMEEEDDQEEIKLAVDPVGPSGAGPSTSRPVFRSSVTLNVNQVLYDFYKFGTL